MTCLNNKSVLITGGSSGLGAAAAILMAKDGAKIAIAARRRLQGEEVVQKIEAAGGEATFIEADVTKSTDVERMVDEVVKHYGRLDCAVNNAGVAKPFVAVADIEEEDWNTTIGVNLTGVWLCMKYEIRAMLMSGGGSIVNISSIYGQKPSDLGDSAYSASKHGVIGLSGSAAIDYAKDGIRVNSVCPGFCHSEMVDPEFEAQPELAKAILNRHSAVARLGESDEAAATMAWLCSDESSFVNGATLTVDGGTTTRLY
ncbi:MAG: SDR family oxidoreductase [Deltaproteobacteria bacterium]|nr:SDR family oxidoreductase [Deltaproteobacteria bacterium]